MSGLENLDPNLTIEGYLKHSCNKGTDKDGNEAYISFDDFKEQLTIRSNNIKNAIEQLSRPESIVNKKIQITVAILGEMFNSCDNLCNSIAPDTKLVDAVKFFPGTDDNPLKKLDETIMVAKLRLGIMNSRDSLQVAGYATNLNKTSQQEGIEGTRYGAALKATAHNAVASIA